MLQAVLVVWLSSVQASPNPTFHSFDVLLVQTARVLHGDGWARSLPVVELGPVDKPGIGPAELWASVPSNAGDQVHNYKKSQPLSLLVMALLPGLLGVGAATLRLGPFLVLWALVAVLAAGVSTRHRRAAVWVALLLFVPSGWQVALLGLPSLGMMLATGLVAAVVLASKGLRRPGLGVLTGVALGVGTWTGESAGDALLVLICGAPLLVAGAGWGVLEARGAKRLVPIGVLGAAAAAAWVLVDRPWLELHLGAYVLREASVEAGPGLWMTLWQHLLYEGYPDAVVRSLLTPVGAVCVGLGVLWALSDRRSRLPALVLVSGPLVLLLVLSMPDKAGDYYALPAVPPLILAAALGVSQQDRRVRWGVGALVGWLVVSSGLHLSLHSEVAGAMRCSPAGAMLIDQTVKPCVRSLDKLRTRHSLRTMRGMVSNRVALRRQQVAWLTHGPGRAWLEGLPRGADLVVLDDGKVDADAALVAALVVRPDLVARSLPDGPRGIAGVRFDGAGGAYLIRLAHSGRQGVGGGGAPPWLLHAKTHAVGDTVWVGVLD